MASTVTATGSSASTNSFSGTCLNMYSAGNSNSSFDSRSRVWRVMNSYTAFMSPWGKPIIVSIVPMPSGMAMCEYLRLHRARRRPVDETRIAV